MGALAVFGPQALPWCDRSTTTS